MEDLVLVKNNKAVCDSLIVADKFKKMSKPNRYKIYTKNHKGGK